MVSFLEGWRGVVGGGDGRLEGEGRVTRYLGLGVYKRTAGKRGRF